MNRPLLVAAALAAASPAFGQAFPQPKGEGRVIVSAIYSDAGRGFDADGRTIDIADYQRSELYLLGEYGVTDDVTLLVTPSLRRVRIDGEQTSSGIGFVDLGARWRVAGDQSRVFSLQARARIPGSTRRDLPAQIGATDPEFDLRAQGGIGFGRGHFAILEAGYRIRANDPPDEVHIDATIGVRVAPKLLVIGNSFNVLAVKEGQGIYRKHRYHNVYASAAYELTPRVTLQAGVLGTVAGRYALRERGAFLGAWFRF